MTLLLGLSNFAITVIVGLLTGIAAALKRGTSIDHAAMAFSIFVHSMPNFFLLFSMTWRLLPSSGGATWWHLILPAVTLGTINAGTVARFTRSSMLEVLHQPYMRTARAKGLRLTWRVMSHAIPFKSFALSIGSALRGRGLVCSERQGLLRVPIPVAHTTGSSSSKLPLCLATGHVPKAAIAVVEVLH